MSEYSGVLLPEPHPSRRNAIQAIRDANDGTEIILKPSTRTVIQNSKMWAMLTEVSEQVPWYGQHLTKDEWKDVFSASLKRQKVVPGLDGGFVVCGMATHKMSKREMIDMIDVMYAFGADPAHPVVFKNLDMAEPPARYGGAA